MFAKVKDGQLFLAPKEFVIDVLLNPLPEGEEVPDGYEPAYEKRRVVGFTPDFLMEQGYKPVRFTEPKEGETLDTYTETETEIIQHWEAEDALTPMMGIMGKENPNEQK